MRIAEALSEGSPLSVASGPVHLRRAPAGPAAMGPCSRSRPGERSARSRSFAKRSARCRKRGIAGSRSEWLPAGQELRRLTRREEDGALHDRETAARPEMRHGPDDKLFPDHGSSTEQRDFEERTDAVRHIGAPNQPLLAAVVEVNLHRARSDDGSSTVAGLARS